MKELRLWVCDLGPCVRGGLDICLFHILRAAVLFLAEYQKSRAPWLDSDELWLFWITSLFNNSSRVFSYDLTLARIHIVVSVWKEPSHTDVVAPSNDFFPSQDLAHTVSDQLKKLVNRTGLAHWRDGVYFLARHLRQCLPLECCRAQRDAHLTRAWRSAGCDSEEFRVISEPH